LLALQQTALLLFCRHRVGCRISAPEGLISRWQRRSAVRRVHLHGEEACVDIAEAQRRMDEIHAQLAGVVPDRIIDMD